MCFQRVRTTPYVKRRSRSLLGLLGLTLLLVGCGSNGSSGSITPQQTDTPQVTQRAVTNLLDLYRTALLQEDIDRLDTLSQPSTPGQTRRPPQEGTSGFVDIAIFREDMAALFRLAAVTDLRIPDTDVEIAADRSQITFTEIETVEIPATFVQQTRLFRTTLQLTQDTVEGLTTFRIAAIQRQGPLVQVTTAGQLLAATPARVTVVVPQLRPTAIDITIPETGLVQSLVAADATRFQGLFTPPGQTPPEPLRVRVHTTAGAVISVTHPYRLRLLGEGVAERIRTADAQRFFAVAIAPDGTIWLGGEAAESSGALGTLIQIAADGRTILSTRQPIGAQLPVGATAHIEDLVFDSRGRLHILFVAQAATGEVVNNGVLVQRTASGESFCQTVNVFDPTYPFQAPDTQTATRRPSPSTRMFAAEDGDIWLFGSDGGIARVVDTLREGQCPEGDGMVTYSSVFRREESDLLANTVPALTSTPDGSLWLGTAFGLTRLQNGQFTAVPFDPELSLQGDVETLETFFQAVAEAIFAAQPLTTVGIGDVSFIDAFGSALVKGDLIFSAATDEQGRVWVGTLGAGVRRIEIQAGIPQETLHLTQADGLGSNIIFALAVGPDATVWAATDEGVSRIRDIAGTVTITNFSALDGLATPVRDIAVHTDGTVWLATDDGVFRLSREAGQLEGVVLEPDRQPVVGADVILQGTPFRAVTDSEGHFVLANLPRGTQRVQIDGQAATSGPFTAIARDVEIIDGTPSLPPLTLVRRAPSVPFDPTQGGVVAFPSGAGAQLDIAAGTAQVPAGVEPALQLTLLPLTALPHPLSEGSIAIAAADLRPGGVVFTTPAQLTLPNQGGHPAGQLVTLLQLEESTLTYRPIGFGQVSADGTVITTISGGVSRLAPVLFAATPSNLQTSLTAVAGEEQTGVVGAPLPIPLTVAIRDETGQGIAGVPVTFTVTAGQATLTPAAAQVTDAQGQAAVTLTLGVQLGEILITVRAANLPPVVFGATAVAGRPGELLAVAGDAQTGVVNTTLPAPLVVVVRDAMGNPVVDQAVTFTIATGTGILTPPTPPLSDTQGRAAVTLTLGTRAENIQVLASVEGLPAVLFSATAIVGPPRQLVIVSGDAQTGTVGTDLAPLVVSVLDATGNPISNVPLTFAITVGNGQLSTLTATTDANGAAATTFTAGITAGRNRVEARALTLVPVSFSLTSEADRATARLIRVAGNNQTGVPGTLLPTPFVVRIQDQFANPIVGVELTADIIQGVGELLPLLTTSEGLQQSTANLAQATASATQTLLVTDERGEARLQVRLGDSDDDLIVAVAGLGQRVQFLAIIGMVDLADLPLDIAVDGNTVYIAAAFGGLQVIDAQDPTAPQIVQTLALDGVVFNVAVADGLAYVATFTPTVLYVLDVRDAAQPTIVGCLQPVGTTVSVTCQESAVFSNALTPVRIVVRDNLAYVALEDRTSRLGALHVVDVTSPEALRVAGALGLTDRPRGLTVANDFAYIPTTGVSGLQVIDISDAAQPTLVAAGARPELQVPSGITSIDNAAYVVESVNDGLQLRVLDLSTPGAPVLQGTAPLPAVAVPFTSATIAVMDHFAYVASFDLGLQVFDVQNPEAPRFVGGVDTPSVAFNVAAATDATRTLIYVTDLAVGLNIVAGPPDDAADSDSDGVIDFFDALPGNPNEALDTDRDGLGNNTDTDDDNDGFSDDLEADQNTNSLNARQFPITPPVLDANNTLFVDAAAQDNQGDGSASRPYRSIRAALQAVSLLRGDGFPFLITVVVRAGVYSSLHTLETFPLFVRDGGVVLRGEGADVTIIDAAFFADVLDITTGGVTLEGLTLQNGVNGAIINASRFAPEVTLHANHIVNNLFIGVSAGFGVPVALTDSEIATNGFRGVEIFTCTTATIMGNSIHDNGEDGIFVLEATVDIRHNDIAANAQDGIQINASCPLDPPGDPTASTIANNTIRQNTAQGILLSERARIRSLQENLVEANLRTGVIIQSGATATVSANTIISNGFENGHGILVSSQTDGTIITGNTIADNGLNISGGAGIILALQGTHTVLTDNLLQGNVVGINVFLNASAVMMGNTVRESFRSATCVSVQQDDICGTGVVINVGAVATMANDEIRDNQFDGVFIGGNSTATITSGIVAGNQANGIFLTGISQADIGLADGSTVTLAQNADVGIFVTEDGSEARINRDRIVFENNATGDIFGNVIDLTP